MERDEDLLFPCRQSSRSCWLGWPQPCCQLSTHHCLFSVAAELWVGARVAEKGDFSPVLPQGPAPQAEDDRQQLKGFCF